MTAAVSFVDRPPRGYRWGLTHDGEPKTVRVCAICGPGTVVVPFPHCPCTFFDRRALFYFSSPFLSRHGIPRVLVESRSLATMPGGVRVALAQERPRLDNPYGLLNHMWAFVDALTPLTLRAAVLVEVARG